MAYAILGTPKPQFFDSSGAPLASGTLTIQDPDDSSAKDWYPTAADADADTNSASTAITLDSRGEPSTQLWGRDGEDYKIILKDSSGSTIYTLDEIRLPLGSGNQIKKVKTADESLTDTTLASDTHLQNFTLSANTYYSVDGFLLVAAAGASQDLKIDIITAEAEQDSQYTFISVDAGSALTVDQGETQSAATDTTIDVDGTSNVGIIIRGFVFTNALTSSTYDLRVAQGTDSGTTTLKKGSWLKFEPLTT